MGNEITERLAYLRSQIEAEQISYGEIAELQSLAEHIDSGDVLLLEWAGVPEFSEDGTAMSVAFDGGPRAKFTGNEVKIAGTVEAEFGPAEVVVTHTHEGVVIDVVDSDSGEVVGTESMTWDEIADRIVN